MAAEKRNLHGFEVYLKEQEKSRNTIEKYVRDVGCFLSHAGADGVTREAVLSYKKYLVEHYKISSVNSMVTALNCYLKYLSLDGLCVKTCRQQRQIFLDESRELSRTEYARLVQTARSRGNLRLCIMLQTVASTGIRIGELKYITVEDLKERKVSIDFKGKCRIILLPQSLIVVLKDYCRKMGIKKGRIFVTKSGRAIDRRNIWAEMKGLCRDARVQPSKVFPHNLRHLFAKCFYEKEKDLMRLADYLGHSSVDTTRRYVMISTAEACRRQLELGLLVHGTTKQSTMT